MYRTLRIDDSTVTWFLTDADATELAAELAAHPGPVAVPVQAPLPGRLILSPTAMASAAILAEPPVVDWLPSHIEVPAAYLYLPSADGPTEAHPGYRLLGGTDLTELEATLMAAMRHGRTVRVDVSDERTTGVLILNGAHVAYVVLAHSGAPAPDTGD